LDDGGRQQRRDRVADLLVLLALVAGPGVVGREGLEHASLGHGDAAHLTVALERGQGRRIDLGVRPDVAARVMAERQRRARVVVGTHRRVGPGARRQPAGALAGDREARLLDRTFTQAALGRALAGVLTRPGVVALLLARLPGDLVDPLAEVERRGRVSLVSHGRVGAGVVAQREPSLVS